MDLKADSVLFKGLQRIATMKAQANAKAAEEAQAKEEEKAKKQGGAIKYGTVPEMLDWSPGCKLTDPHVKMYDTCNKYDRLQAKKHFDYISSNYEGMYMRMGYPDPQMVASQVAKQIKKNGQDPAEVLVLDFGCGTGLIGKYLAEYGINNIDGIDISPKMLELARSKGVYRDLEEYIISQDPNLLPQKYKNKYDYVTCSGLINNNHMEYLLFEELILTCKKHGHVVFAARYSFMGRYWYDMIIKEMMESNRWKLLATDTSFKYDKLECVSIGRFSRTPVKVFVFEKTQEDLNTYVNRYNYKIKQFLINKFNSKK